MKIKEITGLLESIAPLALQESYDNSGLLVGNPDTEVTGILLCLDSTEEIVTEAIEKGCNLIIAHHPVIFSGLKKLNGKNYIERTVISAIRNDIAIYACHTNLDNVLKNGVNEKIASKLGLKNLQVLAPKHQMLKKLVTFCPEAHSDVVREALFSAGAGNIGNYDQCSFNLDGTGTFRAGEGASPFVGKPEVMHEEKETRIETIFPFWKKNQILDALFQSHPYEEVAYDIYPVDNPLNQTGSGITGELDEPVKYGDFLEMVKRKMGVECIRYTASQKEMVQKIAICGGSGSFLLGDAIRAGADAFLTSDFKYHQFFDGEGKLMIADIGHYECEYFTIEIFYELIVKNFPNFAVIFTSKNTNPVKYYL